jgi:hypothetical protein
VKTTELKQKIENANKQYGYERFSFITGYKTRYGLLNKNGVVERVMDKKAFIAHITEQF